MKSKEKKEIIYGLRALAVIIGTMILLNAYPFFNNLYEERLFRDNTLETESDVTGWYEGRTGYRSPKYGYFNSCKYYIGEDVHYFNIFTSVKPLPLGDKFTIKYYQYKKGWKKGKVVTVGNTEDLKLKYDGYGICDYGY